MTCVASIWAASVTSGTRVAPARMTLAGRWEIRVSRSVSETFISSATRYRAAQFYTDFQKDQQANNLWYDVHDKTFLFWVFLLSLEEIQMSMGLHPKMNLVHWTVKYLKTAKCLIIEQYKLIIKWWDRENKGVTHCNFKVFYKNTRLITKGNMVQQYFTVQHGSWPFSKAECGNLHGKVDT